MSMSPFDTMAAYDAPMFLADFGVAVSYKTGGVTTTIQGIRASGAPVNGLYEPRDFNEEFLKISAAASDGVVAPVPLGRAVGCDEVTIDGVKYYVVEVVEDGRVSGLHTLRLRTKPVRS